MNGQDFQQLAAERLEDARVLLVAQRYSAAFYVGGYAVECALKACICKRTKAGDFPPPPKDINRIYTHKLGDLVSSAGIEADFKERKSNPSFRLNWKVVEGWSEEDRYQQKTQKQATDLVAAIDDPEFGVLQWLRGSW
jgi:HEPN domain-containing protein